MSITSEITFKDIWPRIYTLGLIELRINDRTVWSDGVLDCMSGRPDYDDIYTDYLNRAEKEGLLTVLSDGIKEKPLYRSYWCPTCGKRIKVALEMFKEA